ncbi:MAG: PQQ-binding-like beta-propeller repeat protein [Prolixibacteraceae bacterium]|nr:PQQ-binding-like beta-propeller repeat protein [Prolixibacteraceae bacterium]
MKRNIFIFLILAALVILTACKDSRQWSQFRGPYASGSIETNDIPIHWNIETSENIKWQAKIPGLGHSSPIIWVNKIFLTTAISTSGFDSLKIGLYGDIDNINDSTIHELRVICLDKRTGKELWNQLVYNGVPKTKRHTKASHADPTPATDGKHVVAFFGSNGLYCFDMNGNLKWEKDLGKINAGFYYTPDVEWDVSSSPILYDKTIFIQCDNLNHGFIVAIDAETGEERWRTGRDDVSSYSAPTFYSEGPYKQIIANGYKQITGYDFETGKEIWTMSGGGDVPVPTPFYSKDLIYIHSAHGKKSPIYAIKPNAKGDITLKEGESSNEFIAWSMERGGAYIPTSLVYGNYFYSLIGWIGRLTCYNAKTGEKIYEDKLPDARGITASGIATDGKLFYCTELGDVYIVSAGDHFNILAHNSMNDVIMATPALSDNTLFIRTQHALFAIGK